MLSDVSSSITDITMVASMIPQLNQGRQGGNQHEGMYSTNNIQKTNHAGMLKQKQKLLLRNVSVRQQAGLMSPIYRKHC